MPADILARSNTMNRSVQLIATAPGINISVTIVGTGPLVILMHGWPELGLSWRHQIAPLAAAGYTVAVPDMRGYGESSKPNTIEPYNTDALADDMMAIATTIGAQHWVAVGHDWGSPVAWRCALRFPEAVVGVFSLSVPHVAAGDIPAQQSFEQMYPDRFYYVRYFQEIGPAEIELEKDVRAALKTIFFALSGTAPKGEWAKQRPQNSPLLSGLITAPEGALGFMSDDELDQYAEAYRNGGFFGPLSWYRNLDSNADQARAYGDQGITQPAGFLCGDKEIILSMAPMAIAAMRSLCSDLRCAEILPGAGHWIQQERPEEVNRALLHFLRGVWADTET